MTKVGTMNGNWIRREKRIAIYERDGWACAYCGRGPRVQTPLRETGVVLSLDHLTPRSEGGTNTPSNLVTVCISCNSSRGARSWTDYAPAGAQERIRLLIQQPLDIELGKRLMDSLCGSAVEAER